MKTTLTNKLLKFVLPLLIIPVVLMLAFYYTYLTHLIKDETVEVSKIVFKQKNIIIENLFNSKTELHNFLQIKEGEHPLDITLVDKDLTIIADQEVKNVGTPYVMNKTLLQSYIDKALEKHDTNVTYYRQERLIVKPLLNSNNEIVAFTLCDYKNILDKKLAIIDQTFLYILLIIIFLTFINIIFTIIFSYNLVTPVKSLIEGTNIISNGNLSYTINISSDDEIGVLVDSFNEMVTKLKTSEQNFQNLNQNLELRVKEEVEKSRDKDQILIQQSKMAAMGEMIANIAHQWRQPLNSLGLIIQNIELNHKLGTLNESVVIQTVKRGNMLIQSMSQTIDDFGNFFKPNKEKKLFYVSESIDCVKDIMEINLKQSKISMKIDVDENAFINGYTNEFSQVLLNLVSNAKDALNEVDKDEKYIKLHTYKKDGYVYLEVSDNAGGIPSSVIDKIFDPYFTTKDEGKGTGIGLYMSKMIIETNMQGKINVTNLQDGALFTIKIKEN